MDNVERIIDSYCNAGLYTHVYTACGFLNQPEPIFERSLLPEGRTIFDLSSLTKAIVTTPLVLRKLYSAGQDPDTTTLEQAFGRNALEDFTENFQKLTVSDVLRHETGLPAWRNLYVECEGRQQTLVEALIRSEKDVYSINKANVKKDLYSDLGFMLLALLLERSSQTKLEYLWAEFLSELGFHKLVSLGGQRNIKTDQAVPTAFCPVRGRMLVGEVHDENAWALGGFPGHAGLFGSGPAISHYLHLLWSNPVGRKVIEANFSKSTSSGESLLGWRKGRDSSSRTFAEGRACGHMGFTGTALWLDPVTRSYALVLTNRVISGRVPGAIKEMRAQSLSALWTIIQNAK